jgi:hypothetical protein
MTFNRNESIFSSKELNKILPSYILEEIDKEHSESETQDTNQFVSLIMINIMFNYFKFRIYLKKR